MRLKLLLAAPVVTEKAWGLRLGGEAFEKLGTYV